MYQVLRYINQAPSHELKNSKWQVKDGKVKVKTLEAIKTGCEFYLDYSQDTLQFSAPEYMSIDALEQQEKIIRQNNKKKLSGTSLTLSKMYLKKGEEE